MIRSFLFLLSVMTVLCSVCYAYEPSSWDVTVLENVERKITAIAQSSNVYVLPTLQEKLATVLWKLPSDGKAYYLLSQIQMITSTALADATLGEEYDTRKNTYHELTSGTRQEDDYDDHFFQYVSINDIHLKDDAAIKMTLWKNRPSFYVTISNSSTGTITQNVVLICGKDGFSLYTFPKATKIRLLSGSSSEIEVKNRDRLSDSVGKTAGDITIDCRIYDAYDTQSYRRTTATLKVIDPDVASDELDIDLWISSLQEMQVRTSTGSKEDRTVNVEINNSGKDTFTWSVSIACYSPSTREDDDFDPSYSSLSDVVVGPGKRSIAARAIGTYAQGVALECRLDPKAIASDDNRKNEVGKITFK